MERKNNFTALKTLRLIGALSVAGAFSGLVTSCDRTTYPEGAELNKRATLIDGPAKRCTYIKNRDKVQLVTRLFLDTDGNRSTYEYVALDIRSLDVCGKESLLDYEKAINSLPTGENRTLREWQNVAPNIYLSKYYDRK